MTVEPYDAVDVIRAKRDGGVVPEPALRWMVDAYTRGVVADEQMSALLMAIFLRGMTGQEIARWTAIRARAIAEFAATRPASPKARDAARRLAA